HCNSARDYIKEELYSRFLFIKKIEPELDKTPNLVDKVLFLNQRLKGLNRLIEIIESNIALCDSQSETINRNARMYPGNENSLKDSLLVWKIIRAPFNKFLKSALRQKSEIEKEIVFYKEQLDVKVKGAVIPSNIPNAELIEWSSKENLQDLLYIFKELQVMGFVLNDDIAGIIYDHFDWKGKDIDRTKQINSMRTTISQLYGKTPKSATAKARKLTEEINNKVTPPRKKIN
ncbi:MAG: hypothetical protein JNJ47_07335, partial [Alphaproteobacteria bacterium]|nr:hypothetical protein [Alphaproteobacteria bacterium]